ncbi:methionyl-tRNA formyltransferase [Synechococcus sp. HB1133]|uniref:methionyl-tRNA formyltransferase n=1 Tax=unclassified Synechococcus TaxID=2626047 RepID=UPI00140DDD09|nr:MULTISPECIES: methionyl-tRNA formyltransferase [unclassified Synechococcus]MCB4394926.1 methionyl-tRNA formyltransferase [Synechococcus sp. PH41509]MCB4421826.1 methionyl-tRNA formyltransferase [Synechococcus sp. HB1133]MCB4430227.1 methionyl-tRNA formyltransferase [Synechococcus sp. HBA1120]NHI80768.1 methionyl-tRNA formyltransferase [Synechococcus sp. HB1133]
MRILFWGTPAYAVPTLDALHKAGHTIVGVVTQPDRRRGRGNQLVPSPVKARAEQLLLPVFTPERIRRDDDCKEELAALGADASVVVAFGQILPKDVLQQPRLGCWNGHGSLLPRWRGAGPIQWALLEGDEETGVGIMAMEEGLDTGPVLLEQRIPIQLLDTSIDLAERLSSLTAELMVEAMPLIEAAGPGSEPERLSRLKVRAQAEESSYARMLEKQDFRLDWSAPALSIHRKVMGLYPGAFTYWQGKRLKVLRCEPLIERLKDQLSTNSRQLVGQWPTGAHAPGTILAVLEDQGLVVSSSGCPLLIREAQLEGKARSTAPVLLQQLKATSGDRFDVD